MTLQHALVQVVVVRHSPWEQQPAGSGQQGDGFRRRLPPSAIVGFQSRQLQAWEVDDPFSTARGMTNSRSARS